MNVRLFFSCIIISILLGHTIFAQVKQTINRDKLKVLEPEAMIGSIVPNYLNHPVHGMQFGFGLNFFKVNYEQNSTNTFFKYPKIGLHTAYHYLGNPEIFGSKFNLMPQMELAFNKASLKLGLGTSYFTKTHFSNELNLTIGSRFNWSFHTFYYRYLPLGDRFLKVGFGYLHSSNGHTQLPNYGINSAVISVGITTKPHSLNYLPERHEIPKTDKRYFIQSRVGIGYHELGGTIGPVGGEKKAVYGASSSVGMQFKNHLNVYAGLGYRYYQSFADSINNSPELITAKVTPSNFYFISGVEFLIYHLGISVEGGLNLYKSFYPHFAEAYESTDGWDYPMKRFFLSRMGLKIYMFKQEKRTTYNMYIAAHINANFGQADFSGLSIGFIRYW